MHPRVAQCHILRQLVAHDVCGRLRQDDLTTVRESTQPRAPMYCRPLVVSVRQLRFPRVQSYPNANRRIVGPRFGMHRALESNCTLERRAGPREHGERAVTLTLISGTATAE